MNELSNCLKRTQLLQWHTRTVSSSVLLLVFWSYAAAFRLQLLFRLEAIGCSCISWRLPFTTNVQQTSRFALILLLVIRYVCELWILEWTAALESKTLASKVSNWLKGLNLRKFIHYSNRYDFSVLKACTVIMSIGFHHCIQISILDALCGMVCLADWRVRRGARIRVIVIVIIIVIYYYYYYYWSD